MGGRKKQGTLFLPDLSFAKNSLRQPLNSTQEDCTILLKMIIEMVSQTSEKPINILR